MARDLAASRELAWRLFVRDTRAQYRQSILGYVWAFLPPIATTAIFVFLNSQQIVNIDQTGMPYAAFVVIGTILWQTFYDALNSPLKSVSASRSMLTKINFPREALILGGLADVIFNFLVRLTLLLPVFLVYHLDVHRSLLLLPIGVIGLILLGAAIGTLLVPIGMIYTDIGRGVALFASFWMLLTPVVYPIPKGGFGATLAHWNPVTPVLQTSRDWISGQSPESLGAFLAVSGVSAVLLFVGWVMFRLALPHIIDRIGN